MTTFYPFTPSVTEAPTFSVTLDGAPYTITARWNIFGRRWYLECTDTAGDLVFAVPLVTTPPAIKLSALTWDKLSNAVTATAAAAHGYAVGALIDLTITGATPEAYNGAYRAKVIGARTFIYPLSTDPGIDSVAGYASRILSMSAGYFTSTVAYRNGQLEVSP